MRVFMWIESRQRPYRHIAVPAGIMSPLDGELLRVVTLSYDLVGYLDNDGCTQTGYLLNLETVKDIQGLELVDNRPKWAYTMNREELEMGVQQQLNENYFTYHAPKENQIGRYFAIREAGKTLANVVAELCPDSSERSIAIAKIREAVMWANSAIACNEEPS